MMDWENEVYGLKKLGHSIISDFEELFKITHDLAKITDLPECVLCNMDRIKYEINETQGVCCEELYNIMSKLDRFLEEGICTPPQM